MHKPILLSLAIIVAFFVSSCVKDNTPLNKVPIADAGPYRQVSFPDTAILKGSGTDEDGTIVGYLWSQVAGPAQSTLVNPGDSLTDVSFPMYGSYQFQLMVVDDDGATGVDTVSVLVSKPPIDSVTLTTRDAGYIDLTFAGNANDNYTDPTTPELALTSWTRFGLDDELRAAFRFNLSSFSSSTTIISAKLSLFSNPTPINGNQVDANYGPTNAFFIRRATSDWDLNSGWFTQPSTTIDSQVYIPQTDKSRLDLIDVNVTGIVQDMLTKGNHGFFLQLEKEVQYNSRIFCNSRYSDSTKRPLLKIVYQK